MNPGKTTPFPEVPVALALELNRLFPGTVPPLRGDAAAFGLTAAGIRGAREVVELLLGHAARQNGGTLELKRVFQSTPQAAASGGDPASAPGP
jgi:hypothetical protein